MMNTDNEAVEAPQSAELEARVEYVAEEIDEVVVAEITPVEKNEIAIPVPGDEPQLVLEFEENTTKEEIKQLLREFEISGRLDGSNATVSLSEVRVAPHRLRSRADEPVRYVVFCQITVKG